MIHSSELIVLSQTLKDILENIYGWERTDIFTLIILIK